MGIMMEDQISLKEFVDPFTGKQTLTYRRNEEKEDERPGMLRELILRELKTALPVPNAG